MESQYDPTPYARVLAGIPDDVETPAIGVENAVRLTRLTEVAGLNLARTKDLLEQRLNGVTVEFIEGHGEVVYVPREEYANSLLPATWK